MNLESLIEVLNKKLVYLTNLRLSVINVGDIDELTRIDIEIEEIRSIIRKLES